jgi:hypothetical protein
VNARNKETLAREVARMGLPPLQAEDGLVELSIQECRGKERRVIENYAADPSGWGNGDLMPRGMCHAVPVNLLIWSSQ